MAIESAPAAARPFSAAGALAQQYAAVRRQTELLCAPLNPEDYVIQSMPDVSPTKWHLAHTSWFFETFVLGKLMPGYRPFHPQYGYLFNSYYVSVGPRHCRPRRGLLSRPTVAEIFEYRRYVDEHMQSLLDGPSWDPQAGQGIVELGLNHEQQHQELMLTDIKHVLSCNPLWPAYQQPDATSGSTSSAPLLWEVFDEGLHWIGHDGKGFAFDNESPRHRQFLEAFELASRPVSNEEYVAFIEDGGYRRATLWLSDGWATVEAQCWNAPLYWQQDGNQWYTFTLSGLQPLHPAEPVCHLSYYEADAFARWAGARPPTEAEWEAASQGVPVDGNFLESGRFHPSSASAPGRLAQMFGDVWEWTSSPYVPYPGYRPSAGALGEYNAKFMCNQLVLRGGSCATPRSHIRRTYRNFFAPASRWQFMGLRLARDV